MDSDKDDVSKLLGQIKLQDFPYRAFGRGEPSPLRIVRSVDGIAPPVDDAAVSKNAQAATPAAVAAPIAETKSAPVVAVAAPVVRTVTPAAAQPSARVGEAFERLARASATSGAPHLDLKLNLPKRPALINAGIAHDPSECRLQEAFERLRRAAIPEQAKPRVGSGN
jgi:hypothetical protein